MKWFRKTLKDEGQENTLFKGVRCPLDSTIDRQPLWIKFSPTDWTAERKDYRKAREAKLASLVIGLKDAAGYEVTNVLSRADEYAIYEVKASDGTYSIRVDVQSLVEEDPLLLERWTEIVREYYITKRVLFKVNDSSVRERIANILSRCLSTGYSSEAVQDLKDLQFEINGIYTEKIANSLKYLGTIIGITLCFVIYSITIYSSKYFSDQKQIELLILSATAGCIGGFFSVSIRLRQMLFEREIPGWTYVLYGFERMVVSICGSVIALLAIRGGFAFAFAEDTRSLTLLVCVAAGFSETLIPNLLVKVESEKK